MSKMVPAYIAITRGKKPRTQAEIRKASGFNQQHLSIARFAELNGHPKIVMYLDHSTYRSADFFLKPQFLAAVDHAVRDLVPIFAYNVFRLLQKLPLKTAIERLDRLRINNVLLIDTLDATQPTLLTREAVAKRHISASKDRKNIEQSYLRKLGRRPLVPN